MFTYPINEQQQEIWTSILLSSIVFLINPLVGILIATFRSIYSSQSQPIVLVLVLTAIYLSALNTTKMPVSDMAVYLDMFQKVPQNGFQKTLSYLSTLGDSKDVAYSSIVYLSYYLFEGNQYVFIFIISFVSFTLAFLSIYKFGIDNEEQNYLVIAKIFTLAFFTQYFSLSFHLVRQELATSIFFFALTFKADSLGKYLMGCIIAVLVHSSILVIVLLSLIPFMNRILKIREIMYLVLFSTSFIIVFSSISSFLLLRWSMSGELLKNVMRLSEMQGMQDASNVMGANIIILFSLFLGILSLMEILRKQETMYNIITNLCFVWSILILSLAASPLLQYRFFFIEYTFLPFMLYMPLYSKSTLLPYLCFCVVSFLIIRFFMTFNNVFQYTPLEGALLDPLFMLMKLS